MWDWLARRFPKRSLEEVGSGAHLRVPVTVASPSTLASSIGPERGAAVRWALCVELSTQGGRQQSAARWLHPFATGWRGGLLSLRAPCGRIIGVDLVAGVALGSPIDPEDGSPLGTTPASTELYGELAQRAPRRVGQYATGMVYVREQVLSSGQSLELRGFVVPHHAAGGYRAAEEDGPPFRAVRDVVLIER